jgi:uncharacterized membrane protein HdeD (DUF308 family)
MSRKKQEAAPAAEQQPQEPKNPVLSVTKHIMELLKNKLVASLLLFAQGILFLVAPSGDMELTIRISAGIIILACTVMLVFHLKRKPRKVGDYILAVINGLLILAAAFFLFKPVIIEPYVKIAVGGVTIVMSLINLFETLKIKEKKDWKFIVSVVGAVAMMALGIFMIVADERQIAIAQRSIGAFLILNALANIWYMVQLHQQQKKMEKAVRKAVK